MSSSAKEVDETCAKVVNRPEGGGVRFSPTNLRGANLQ